jgi:hypothetical protein
MSTAKLATLLLAAAIGLVVYRRARPAVRKSYVYQGVDAPELPPDATPEEILDAGVAYTFPASDPVAVETAYRIASRRGKAA